MNKNKKTAEKDLEILLGYFKSGQNNKVESLAKSIIQNFPNNYHAWKILAVGLKKNGKLSESITASKKAIEIFPDDAEAYNNLGNTFKELDMLDEAEESYKQAINLNPDLLSAYTNLGITLYAGKKIDMAIDILKKAASINPLSPNNQLILEILTARRIRQNNNSNFFDNMNYENKITDNLLIKDRPVESDLISSLYKIKSIQLDKFISLRTKDARYGNGVCSIDFKLFEESDPIITYLKKDLSDIMKSSLNSDIYIEDSFFNILSSGGGSIPHQHLTPIDNDKYLNLGKQKYSLVYYLSVGDQNCKEPGLLKLYDPDYNILPTDGMIVVIPAHRHHSSYYEGNKDRMMIGVNFYCL